MADAHVINVGTGSFLAALNESGVSFTHLGWRPPAQGNPELVEILFRLSVDFRDASGNSLIDTANALALERICNGRPVLTRIRPAFECLPGLDRNTILHAGPPIDWPDMCGAMKGAVIGALLYEGLAGSDTEAEALMDSGKILCSPTFPHAVAAPMCGVVSYSMPLAAVRNETHGNIAYSPVNEGTGATLRCGAYGPAVTKHLRWMRDVLAPSLDKALVALGGINLKSIMGQALGMGDELHQRNVAASSAFYRAVCLELSQAAPDRDEELAMMRFLGQNNDQFFLNLGMAACRALMDPARNIPYCSMVSHMARNGATFGIQVSALSDTWFLAPSPTVKALYFPGYSEEDAGLDMGDSSIMECCGLGGFAMRGAPAIARAMREGGMGEISRFSQDMAAVCIGRNPNLPMPDLDFSGVPTGIDIRRVVAAGIQPVINTGVSHRLPGFGQIGAGYTNAPIDCMHNALRAFYTQLRAAAALDL